MESAQSNWKLVGLGPEDDDIHPIGAEPWWREAWYFEFFDRQQKLQFNAYQGVFPNQEKGDITFYVFRDGRIRHRLMKMDFTIPSGIGAERLRFGPLRMDLIEPYRKWRILYDSYELQADLIFEAVHPPFSWAEANLWMESATNLDERSQHFDQVGRYSGTVWIDGEAVEIDALGMRDRAWGWGGRRKWKNYVQVWAPFSEDYVVFIAAMNFTNGIDHVCAYLHRDGERGILKDVHLELEWDEVRWKTLRRVRSRGADDRGRTFEVETVPTGTIDTSRYWQHRYDNMLFAMGETRSGDELAYGSLNWAYLSHEDRPTEFRISI